METLEVSESPKSPEGLRAGLHEMLSRAAARKEPSFVVDGLLPTGLSVLAGASKIGKSFMALDIAFGVAGGYPVLGGMVCEPGDVLYLALEDTSTRLRGRLDSLNPNRGEWPFDALTIYSMDMVADTPPGWIANTWADAVENPRLVIIDTITRFGGLGERSGYAAEVKWMSRFHDFAAKYEVALLGLTHTNQMKLEEGDDWFNRISGTTGIIGTADNVMLLDVPRGESEGMLRIEGRDMDPTEHAVKKVGPWWQQTSQIRGRRGNLSVDIADFVILSGEATTAQVAAEFAISVQKASQYLGRAKKAAVIASPRRGVWSST
jgi:RecA-family ATPase